jgi:transcriptional regulator
MSPFQPADPSHVCALVQAYPLCWVVSEDAGSRYATPLPLLPEQDAAGNVASLFGHIARSNPQQAALERDPRATILCMGPQGYISPRLVSNPTWGPTWNYAVCRFETELRFVPEKTEDAVWRLAAALEGTHAKAWTPERMGDRYHELKQRIVAFRATVVETHAKFKLGQDENSVVFKNITDGLDDRMLAEWMSRARTE